MSEPQIVRRGEHRPGSRRTPLVRSVSVDALTGTVWAAETTPSEMSAPYRCDSCQTIYDGGHVTVTARYADCSVWKCPGCRRVHDSRHAWSNAPGARMGYTDLRARDREINERTRR